MISRRCCRRVTPPGWSGAWFEGLDLSAFYATISAREGRAGRPPIDPKIVVGLWLYATLEQNTDSFTGSQGSGRLSPEPDLNDPEPCALSLIS